MWKYQQEWSISSKICLDKRIPEKVNEITSLSYTDIKEKQTYPTKVQHTQKQWE